MLCRIAAVHQRLSTRTRSCYVDGLTESRRFKNGEFLRIIPKLRINPKKHFRYFRMTAEIFDELLAKITPHIKHGKNHRTPISPAERLTITLKILATGNSQASVAHSFCLGYSTVSGIFRETTVAIWEVLSEEYVPEPTRETWEKNADRFGERWNFPNCVGTIDGKHVVVVLWLARHFLEINKRAKNSTNVKIYPSL